MTQPEFDLVSVSEIAAMAGTARSTVSNWKRRHDDFPPERGSNPRGPLYDRAEVADWLANRSANPTATAAAAAATGWENRLWSLSTELRGVWSSEDFTIAVARTLVNLPLPAPLADIAGEERASRFTTEVLDIAGDSLDRREEAIDAVLSRPLGPGLSEFVSPRHLSVFMAALLGPRSSILDPACGVGQNLIACADQTPRLCGQERRTEIAKLARGRLWNVVIGPHNEGSVVAGDSLLEDLFPEPFAGVICAPPFNQRLDPDSLPEADSRWIYEYPGKSGDAAWIQHVVAHLAPGGRGVITLSSSVAFSSGIIDRLRTGLIRSGVLRAVIGLPSKTFFNTAIETVVLVLERPVHPTPDVAVLIASPFDSEDPGPWTDEEGQAAADVITGWLDGGQLEASDHYIIVGLEELAAQRFDITPQRHLRTQADQLRPLTEIHKDALAQVGLAHKIVTDVATALTEISEPVPSDPVPTPLRALGELLTVTRGIPNHKLAKKGSIEVHTPRTLFNNEPPYRFLTPSALEDNDLAPRGHAQPGDILIAVDGTIGRTVRADSAMFVSSMFAILRPRQADEIEIDLRYLAAWLQTPQFQAELARLARGLTMQRLSIADLRSVLIPVPSMELQIAIAEIDQTLEKCTELAEDLATSTERTRDLYREAMAGGLIPSETGKR